MKPQATHNARDEAAIRAVFAQLAECGNRGDGSAYGALFTEDADYFPPSSNADPMRVEAPRGGQS